MSHFAEVDDNDVVVRVIVAEQIFIDSGVVGNPARWVQTSYNATIRERYAGPGFFYDRANDRFLPPRPSPSSTWDEDQQKWV